MNRRQHEKTPQKLTALCGITIALLSLVAAAYLILQGTGMFPRPPVVEVLLLCLFMAALSQTKGEFYGLLLPLVLLHAAYTPTGLNFGPPSYQYIASVFSTDLLETVEFLRQIPLRDYLTAVAIPVLVLIYRQSAVKFRLKLPRFRFLSLVAALGMAYFSPISAPLKESVTAANAVLSELSALKNLQGESRWGHSDSVGGYQDYVLVIGESARRDYHHVFGYPIENTPFLSRVNGTFIDGFTAAGTNTVASLRLMLTRPDKAAWQPNYTLGLVDLAKSAGIKTYWLSNQGYLGEYDTPVAALAAKADESHFLKKGGSFNSTNHSDFELLTPFAQILHRPTTGKRLIVLHLYGAHPLACDRLTDYPALFAEGDIDARYGYLNCYISAIKKTDELLQRVYTELMQNAQKTDRTFSLIYVADHGLCHQTGSDEILFNQNCFSRRHYDVPLVRLSSDDTERRVYRTFKSGLNFTDGIAHWLGVRNPQLDASVDLFSPTPDPDDYGLHQRINQKHRPDDDPAIDIRTK